MVSHRRFGLPRVHFHETDSTNARAKSLAANGAPHGTLVTADSQTAGHGRQGRRWEAPAGSALLMSLLLRELDERHALLPLAAAVALCEACEGAAGIACAIKWPNDVWIERRKVAGILVEGRPQEGWTVLGIGLNVATRSEQFPPELRATATSLALVVDGRRVAARAELLDGLLRALEARVYDAPGAVLGAWRERDALIGSVVHWDGGSGTAAGIDDAGALLVETAAGQVALDAGEVHLEPPGDDRA